MTRPPRSLRSRLLATAAAFIAVALLATGLAVSIALRWFVQGQVDQRLDGQLLTMEAALETGPDGTVVFGHAVDGPPFDNPRTGWFWVVRSPAQTWRSGGLRSGDAVLPPVPPGPFAHPLALDGVGPDGRAVRARADHVGVGGQNVLVVAAAPLGAVAGPLRDALVPLATALLALGAGLGAATLLQVRVGLRPLFALREALVAVRAGRLDALPADQPDEVRPLVAEVNGLLDQHAANLERARRHVANLAHALKTPLASLDLALQEPGADPDGTLRDLALTMDRHVRHHLARARVAALGTAARGSVPLAARVRDHVEAFAKIYADRGVRCRVSVPPDLAVACDAQDVDEMVGNLLDNAFKWSRTSVWVTAGEDGRSVCVTVGDDGPGIDPNRRDAVLWRGRRLDESVPGYGFGLAIVSEIAELYGGGLALSGRVPNGLEARVDLPSPGVRA